MTRWLLVAALVAVIALGGRSWYLQDRVARLSADLTKAENSLAAYERTAEIHRAHIKRMTAEAEAWAVTERELQSMEGRDALLSDHMRRAADRLWP